MIIVFSSFEGPQRELFRVLHTVRMKQEEHSTQLDLITAMLRQNTQHFEDAVGNTVPMGQFGRLEVFLKFDASLEDDEIKRKLSSY